MKRQLEIAFVFLLIIISLKFFDATFLNDSILNYLLFLTLIFTVIISVSYVAPTTNGFVFPIQLLLASMFISILMAGLYWDQNLLDSLIATAPYLIFFFFFYLLHIKFPVKTMEKIIVIYGVLYILLYTFEFINSPTVFFGRSLWGDEYQENRGIVRIIFPGGGVFILTTFLAITKLTSQKKNRWFWLLLTLAGLVIPVLQVTRQFIAGILLIFLYHAIKTFSLSKKVLIFIAFVAGLFFLLQSNLPVIKGLIEATKSDTDLGGDYIRVLAGEYFLTDFSPNRITQFFGNGVAYTGVSNFGYYLDMLEVTQEFFLSDVGIIAVYAMFGVPAIIAYMLIWVKSFTLPLPEEYQYLKYYLWFILLTSLTWYTTFHYHYLVITVYVLYMYHSVYLTEKDKDQQLSISKGNKNKNFQE